MSGPDLQTTKTASYIILATQARFEEHSFTHSGTAFWNKEYIKTGSTIHFKKIFESAFYLCCCIFYLIVLCLFLSLCNFQVVFYLMKWDLYVRFIAQLVEAPASFH